VPLDLSHPAIHDSYEAMLEVASSKLENEELGRWHEMIEACDNLSQADEVSILMIDRQGLAGGGAGQGGLYLYPLYPFTQLLPNKRGGALHG
jgi:hypothetical protein